MDLNFKEVDWNVDDEIVGKVMEAVYHGYMDWYVCREAVADGTYRYCFSNCSWSASLEVQEKSFCEGEWKDENIDDMKSRILELDAKEREWWEGCKKA